MDTPEATILILLSSEMALIVSSLKFCARNGVLTLVKLSIDVRASRETFNPSTEPSVVCGCKSRWALISASSKVTVEASDMLESIDGLRLWFDFNSANSRSGLIFSIFRRGLSSSACVSALVTPWMSRLWRCKGIELNRTSFAGRAELAPLLALLKLLCRASESIRLYQLMFKWTIEICSHTLDKLSRKLSPYISLGRRNECSH